jgi:hypothetical protein
MVGSSCSGNTPNKRAGELVLNASDPITWSGGSSNWKDSIAGDPTNCKTGGFWKYTYSNVGDFQIGSFKMTHNAGFNVYSYWGGFTIGSNGDSYCYSDSCYKTGNSCDNANIPPALINNNCDCAALSGSNGWIYNQWGVMAGGGLDASYKTENGLPYFIAYWDYYSETGGAHSLEVKLNGDSLFNAQEVYIANHPWPYYGNIYGDGFAKPFTKAGDHFDLIIHGVKNNNTEVTQTVTLAYFDAVTNSVQQISNWQPIPFSGRTWTNLKSIYFTMFSTDSLSGYGPNTAVYFNLDKLKVTKTGGVATPAVVTREIKAAPKAVEVKDEFPVASYTGGEVTVHDVTTGKVVYQTTVKAGEKPNLSKLPAGEYRLRHGHKHIPISKVK